MNKHDEISNNCNTSLNIINIFIRNTIYSIILNDKIQYLVIRSPPFIFSNGVVT